MSKTIVITGSSSGIGKASAQYFLDKGWNVVATARNTSKIDIDHSNISKYELDVASSESVKKATDAILKDHSQIDALLNNAGYSLVGPMEGITTAQMEKQFKTNVLGLVEMMQAFLPTFKKQKDGVIINISSIGGRVTMPFNSLYHGTKFAVEGITQSLYYELRPFGVRVRVVAPGGVASNFMNAAEYGAKINEFPEYGQAMQTMVKKFQSNSTGYLSSEDIAKAIYDAAIEPSFEKIQYVLGDVANTMLKNKLTAPEEAFRAGMYKNLLGE